MYERYYLQRSVTRGQKAREALNRAGLRNRLLRAPRVLSPEGCGYALAVPETEAARAEALMERAGVPPEAVYRRLTDGSFGRLGP